MGRPFSRQPYAANGSVTFGDFTHTRRDLRFLAKPAGEQRLQGAEDGVGIRPDGRAPARDGTNITDAAGNAVGAITSGGFGPSVGGPIAMGYVASAAAATGTALVLDVRGKALPARVADLPFVPHRYHKA